jgi:hypothetical protein
MLRVCAKYQHLTCDAGCCFQTAQKWDVIYSRRRRYFAAAGVAAAVASATALSNNPADATSVGPSKVKPAVARKSGHCDLWRRRSAPKSCLHRYSPNSELDRTWRPAPEDALVRRRPSFLQKPTTPRSGGSHGYQSRLARDGVPNT